jgi:pilus assembly protein CpaE
MLNGTQPGAKIFSVTLLTVCVDPNTMEHIVQTAERMPWLVVPADFEAYISAVRRPHLGQQSRTTNACIAVVDFDTDPEQAVETTKYLQQIFSGKIAIVALSTAPDPKLLLLAMRAGCSEFLQKPFDPTLFLDTLNRLQEQWSATSELPDIQLGSVFSFLGAKGGVGSTTLAVHLAMYLVQCHGKKTLLIDNHAQLGHVCIYLGIDGSRNCFNEVVRSVNRLDTELLRGFVAKHSTGLEVLSSPDVCGDAALLDPDSVSRTLEFLRSEYDYVIIDCATSLDEANLAVIRGSTQVYLVATPEIGAIRDLSRYVDKLMLIEYTTEKMHVVINRFSSRYAVNVEQIEKAIHLPVAIKLPNSYTELVRSVNLGEPIAPQSKSEFSSQFTKWVNTLVGSSGRNLELESPKKSVFAMWK